MQPPSSHIPFINAPLEAHRYAFKKMSLELLIPAQPAVKANYEQLLQQEYIVPFPYCAKLWPATKALSTFPNRQPDLIFDKQLLELTAGLGLPSLAAAALGAKKVCVSDQTEEAVHILQ